MVENFRTLFCDPGEDFGWCQSRGTRLLSGGTDKMWPTADNVWAALNNPHDEGEVLNTEGLRAGVDPVELVEYPIGRIVCEDFKIYPWKARELAWDPVRTARVIGALTFMARVFDIPFILQPASIKGAAKAAGAEELYYRPLKENRHVNDSLQHFAFYTSTELVGR